MANETIQSAQRSLSVSISKGSDISDFFIRNTGQDFIGWFNTNCAKKGAWKDRALGNSDAVRQRFNQVWDQFPVMFGTKKISLAQFICLQSIFINEVGADMLPITEKVGRKNHPGLAYPFNIITEKKTVVVNNVPTEKEVVIKSVSYNSKPLSKTALELFNDALYIDTHGHLPQAERLKNTTDQRWHSSVYPQQEFPTSTDPIVSGFIREADFFKFRGRGFIQTTWRANYIPLIQFVQSYKGANAKVLFYKKKWAGRTPDDVATISTNEDWDDLFQNSNLLIPCAGVRSHNRASGNYLTLSSDVDAIIGEGKGSIFRMGLKISGGRQYASLFRSRVIQIMLALHQQVE